jgi:hypothetical protein
LLFAADNSTSDYEEGPREGLTRPDEAAFGIVELPNLKASDGLVRSQHSDAQRFKAGGSARPAGVLKLTQLRPKSLEYRQAPGVRRDGCSPVEPLDRVL